MIHLPSRFIAMAILFWIIIALTGCGGEQRMGRDGDYSALEPASWPQPSFGQASEDNTSPGLSVVYAAKKIRHIDEMPDRDWMVKNGVKGEPILMLAHQFGYGEVFGSGQRQGVCVQMQGYLIFEEAGTYRVKANSNDGIRVFLDNKMILDDPDVHSSRFTSAAEIAIKQPGRYAVQVRYFQRKGEATLELYWKTPGSHSFDMIPARAYSHDRGLS